MGTLIDCASMRPQLVPSNLKKQLNIIHGDDSASEFYRRTILNRARGLGIIVEDIYFGHCGMDSVRIIIDRLNSGLYGPVLVQRPIPYQDYIMQNLSKYVDIDAVTNDLVHTGVGCTAAAVGRILTMMNQYVAGGTHPSYDWVSGKNAVVIGRSDAIGKQIANMLLDMDATVTICHSKTADLTEHLRGADIIVSAVGVPGLVKKHMITNDTVMIDVGMTAGPDGRLHGDFDRSCVDGTGRWLTPTPGGVGTITTDMLLLRTLEWETIC